MTLQVKLFGRLDVTDSVRALSVSLRPRAQRLLAHLLLQRQARTARETVAFTLWPDHSPEEALATLRRALSDVRTALPELDDVEWIVATRSELWWNTSAPYTLDTEEFEKLIHRGTPAATRDAIALYAGDLLADWGDEWVLAERERLRQLQLNALRELIAVHRALRQREAALGFVRQALALDPLAEALHRDLIALHYETGDRAAALAAYDRLTALLRDELDIAPMPETQALAEAIARGEPAHVRVAPHPVTTHNLPLASTPLIGREQDVAGVRAHLMREDTRLLTLVGPPGIGKTRLALQVAAEVNGLFDDGAFFAPLAAITDPDLVLPTIGQALNLDDAGGRVWPERLRDFLRDKSILLVLDNFEQVVAAAPQVSQLIAACPRLKILATSRTALRVRAERQFPVHALELPDLAHLPSAAALARHSAIALFLDRAQAVAPDFEIDEANASAVAHIVHRLDGLPLALELIAARVKVLSPPMLLERLSGRLLLQSDSLRDADERQRTLMSAIAWSYNLLTPQEQMLFRRLGVFAGGWTLEAVELVCVAADPDGESDRTDRTFSTHATECLDVLTSLVTKSMVVRQVTSHAHDEPRYTLLETIREYAVVQLAASGEESLVRRRHGEYFTSLAEHAAAQIAAGLDQKHWLDRLESEQDNLRAALKRALGEKDAMMAVRLVEALRHYWQVRSHFTEGCQWLERTLELFERDEPPSAAKVKVLIALGNLSQLRSDYSRAQQCFDEALVFGRALGERTLVATLLNSLGFLAVNQRDCDFAEVLLTEAMSLSEESNYRRGIAYAALNQGKCAFLRCDYERAIERFERALAEFRTLGNQYMVAFTLLDLGRVPFMKGDYGWAESCFEQGLAMSRELGSKSSEMTALLNLGYVAHVHMRYEQSAALLTDCLRLSRGLGARWAEAASLARLGQLARRQGRLLEATVQLEAGMDIARDAGETWCIAECQDELAHVAMLQGRLAQAEELLRQSLTSFRRQGDQEALLCGLHLAAALALRQSRPERAAHLLGAIEASRERLGLPLSPLDRADHHAATVAARVSLGDSAFAAAWAEGRALSLEQALALALAPAAQTTQQHRDGSDDYLGAVGE